MAYKRISPMPVAEGGTGDSTFTSYAVVCGGTTGTGALQSIAAVGSSGNVLTSNGAGALPTFQAAGASTITITGDSGGGLTSASFTFTGGTTGLTFAGAGSTETLGGTLAIANGGTNATSMSTSTGIVKYDGTRLVTSSTAKIDSSNRMTNSSQPAFLAYKSSASSNVTGDNTTYTIIQDTSVFDQNSNFNTGTGTFTAPITGRYQFTAYCLILGLTAGFTTAIMQVVTTSNSYIIAYTNPGTCATVNGFLVLGGTTFAAMSVNDTATITIVVSNSTKTISVNGTGSPFQTYFSGYLIC